MPSALTQNVVSQKILSICVVQVSDFSHRHLLGGYWKGNGFTLSLDGIHNSTPPSTTLICSRKDSTFLLRTYSLISIRRHVPLEIQGPWYWTPHGPNKLHVSSKGEPEISYNILHELFLVTIRSRRPMKKVMLFGSIVPHLCIVESGLVLNLPSVKRLANKV